MMFHNNLVATIKVGGKILRENKDTVTIPFGSEYSILLKNLSTVRALVTVSVDGTNATEGTEGLIIPANGELELKRFIKNGNFNSGNCFKFIERSEAIENHRGIKADDGLIRVEYKFEEPQKPAAPWNWDDFQKKPWTPEPRRRRREDWPHYPRPYWGNDLYRNSRVTSSTPTRGLRPSFTNSTRMAPSGRLGSSGTSGRTKGIQTNSILRGMSLTPSSMEANDAGITVPGSVSDQKFVAGEHFKTETTSHVIVLKLVGKIAGKVVSQPITVQTKPTCTSCGKVNKAVNKFCAQCGTGLELVS
jgi:hypothetical protein